MIAELARRRRGAPLSGPGGRLRAMISLTGWRDGHGAGRSLLALHPGTVLAFFLTAPYSKMAHGFYRFAALVRDAQQRGA